MGSRSTRAFRRARRGRAADGQAPGSRCESGSHWRSAATRRAPDRFWPSDAKRLDHPHVRPHARPGERSGAAACAVRPRWSLFLSIVFVGSSLPPQLFGDSGFPGPPAPLPPRDRRRLKKPVERRKAELAALEDHVKRLETDPPRPSSASRARTRACVKPGEITLPAAAGGAGAHGSGAHAGAPAGDPGAALAWRGWHGPRWA